MVAAVKGVRKGKILDVFEGRLTELAASLYI